MNNDYSMGNLSSLLELGYVPVGPVVSLPQVDEDVIQNTAQELVAEKKFLELRDGEIMGVAWYNSFFEKWFCDVYRDSIYEETLLAVEMRLLVKSVQALRCRPGNHLH